MQLEIDEPYLCTAYNTIINVISCTFQQPTIKIPTSLSPIKDTEFTLIGGVVFYTVRKHFTTIAKRKEENGTEW